MTIRVFSLGNFWLGRAYVSRGVMSVQQVTLWNSAVVQFALGLGWTSPVSSFSVCFQCHWCSTWLLQQPAAVCCAVCGGGRQIVEFCVYRESFQSSSVTWYDIREGERRTTRFARQQRRPGSIGRFPLSGVKRSTELLSLSAFRWSITAPPRPDDELIALRLD